jgi:hypothetical protein
MLHFADGLAHTPKLVLAVSRCTLPSEHHICAVLALSICVFARRIVRTAPARVAYWIELWAAYMEAELVGVDSSSIIGYANELVSLGLADGPPKGAVESCDASARTGKGCITTVGVRAILMEVGYIRGCTSNLRSFLSP